MQPEVIKEFLVSLGFGVDNASLTGFVKAIAGATLKVEALYGAVKLASEAVFFAISKISEGFEQMGYEFHLIAPAINKTLYLRNELLKAYAASGVSITHVIQQAVRLNYSLAKTKFAFQALYSSVASKFFDILAQRSDNLRAKIYQNMPAIQEVLHRFVNFIFLGIDTIDRAVGRVYPIIKLVFDSIVGVFREFDAQTDGLSTTIFKVVGGFTVFLAILGPIATAIIALIALYDDFKVWQEGGKSFFNWAPVLPIINSVAHALQGVWTILSSIVDLTASFITLLGSIATGNLGGVKVALSGIGDAIINGAKGFNSATGLDQIVAGIHGSPIAGFGSANLGNNIAGPQVNQNVNQQTAIHIQGSSDALATGRAAAGEQFNVNRDLVRNMRGAVTP
jgi:hypothetical protein